MMQNHENLEALTKQELIDLIAIYSKNWLAMDGVWFQSVERTHGMDEAMFHDAEAWRIFTVIEARRLKAFLKLPAHAGLEGLAKALSLRLYANINRDEITMQRNTLLYRTLDCRISSVQIGGHHRIFGVCQNHRRTHRLRMPELLSRCQRPLLLLFLALHTARNGIVF